MTIRSSRFGNEDISGGQMISDGKGGVLVHFSVGKCAFSIYNILVNTKQFPGEYYVSWDGKNEEGKSVGSGVYLYRLKTDHHTQTRKLVYLK